MLFVLCFDEWLVFVGFLLPFELDEWADLQVACVSGTNAGELFTDVRLGSGCDARGVQ